MEIVIDLIVEFFLAILGIQTDKICGDREVPKFVKMIFLVLALGLIAGILFFGYCLYKR